MQSVQAYHFWSLFGCSTIFTPLTIDEYAAKALSTDQRSDGGSLTFPLLGLFGETGSLLSEVEKKQRDQASYLGYAAAVSEELGDVLWYLTIVANRGGLPLKDIIANVDRSCADWQQSEDATLCFTALQPAIMQRPIELTAAFEKTLLRLAGEVGLLVTDHEAGRLTDNQSTLAGRLIAIMRTLIQAANESGVTIEAAATHQRFGACPLPSRWKSRPRKPPENPQAARPAGPISSQ